MNEKNTLTLTRAKAKKLLAEIASVAEAAYRRGAQQAVSLKVPAEDLNWYRYYLPLRDRFYCYANPLPRPWRDGKKWRIKYTDRMEWESWLNHDGPFEKLVNFAPEYPGSPK
jgi:hypothetical protein